MSASSGSVMSPRPCVRPGRVASITTAATTTLTQPKRIVPVSVVQRRLAVGSVEDGVGDIGVSLARPLPLGSFHRRGRRARKTNGSVCVLGVLRGEKLWSCQKVTPALSPNVRGAPFSPMKPEGASGP